MKTIPKTMKAIILKANGDYEQLQYVEDYNVPTPKENEVLIQIKAAAIKLEKDYGIILSTTLLTNLF